MWITIVKLKANCRRFVSFEREDGADSDVLLSVPDLEETVPRSGAYCHAVLGDAQTTDTVVMASQNTCN